MGTRKNMKYGVLGALLACVLFGAAAQAHIMIMPVRVFFGDRDRMKSISIINTADEPAVFRVTLYNMKQIEAGGYEHIEGPLNPDYDLAKLLTFSPRQVSLPVRGKQAVRFSLKRPAGMPDGEYRVHVKLQRVSGGESRTVEDKKGMTARVNVNVGFSVPLIVRLGKYDTTVEMSDVKLVTYEKTKKPAVDIVLKRSGKYSSMGTVRIFWTPPGASSEKAVGILNGVNVYAETSRRRIQVPIKEDYLSGGTLRVVYIGDGEDKGILFDEKKIQI